MSKTPKRSGKTSNLFSRSQSNDAPAPAEEGSSPTSVESADLSNINIRQPGNRYKSSFYFPNEVNAELNLVIAELKNELKKQGAYYVPRKNDFVVAAVKIALLAYRNDTEGAEVTKELERWLSG